jgi:hypothetical protein
MDLFVLQTASANVISLCDYNNCNAAGQLKISFLSIIAAVAAVVVIL